MARNYSISFRLEGMLDPSLVAAVRAASRAMNGMESVMRATQNAARMSGTSLEVMAQALQRTQHGAEQLKTLRTSLTETGKNLASASRTNAELQANYDREAAAVERLKQKYNELKEARRNSGIARDNARDELKELRARERELVRRYNLKIQTKTGQLREAHPDWSSEKILQRARAEANRIYRRQIEEINRKILQQTQSVGELSRQYRELQNAIRNTRNELTNARGNLQPLTQNLAASQSNIRALQGNLDRQIQSYNTLSRSLQQAGFNVGRFAQSEAQLLQEISRVNDALNRQRNWNLARDNFNNSWQNVGSSIADFQNTVATVQSVAKPVADSIQLAVNFEKSMSMVKALTQIDQVAKAQKAMAIGNTKEAQKYYKAVQDSMRALTEQAKELGRTTIFTAQEVADAQVFVARTGWSDKDILTAMPHFVKAAAALNAPVDRVADIFTNIGTAFKHDAAQVARDVDIGAYTIMHSNQDLSQYGDAMKYAAPIAAAVDVTMEQLSLISKLMADAGIQGTMAGTSMRQLILRTTAPPKRGQEAMSLLEDGNSVTEWNAANQYLKEFTGATMDSSGTVWQNLMAISKAIQSRKDLSNREKASAIAMISGINAASGATNFLTADPEKAQAFLETLEECQGAVDRTYDIMTDNAYGAEKAFESAAEASRLSFGSAFLNVVRSAAEACTPLLTATSKFIDNNQTLMRVLVGVAGTAAALLTSMAALRVALAIKDAIIPSVTLMKELFLQIPGFLSPVGAAFKAVFQWCLLFGKSLLTLNFSALASQISLVARALFGLAFSPVGAAMIALSIVALYCYQNWDKVKNAFSGVAGILDGTLTRAIQTVMPAIRNLGSAFESLSKSGLVDFLGKFLVGALATLANALATTLRLIVDLVIDVATTIINIFGAVGDTISNIFSGNFIEALGNMKTGIFRFTEDVARSFSHIGDTFKAAYEAEKTIGTSLEITTNATRTSAVNQNIDTKYITAVADSSASFTPQMQQAAMTIQSFNNSMQSSPSLLQALNNTPYPPQITISVCYRRVVLHSHHKCNKRR